MKDRDDSNVCLKTESVKNPVKYQQDFRIFLIHCHFVCSYDWFSTLGAYKSDV